MRLVIAFFALALLVTASVSFGISASRTHHDSGLHAVHYDSGYDLSAQRRLHPQ